MDYRNHTTDELAQARAAARMEVRRLERRGSFRNPQENEQLKFGRAALREIAREQAKRYQQLKLF